MIFKESVLANCGLIKGSCKVSLVDTLTNAQATNGKLKESGLFFKCI